MNPFLRRMVIRRIRRLRTDDLDYYDNALAGVRERRPMLPAGSLKRFFFTFLLWSLAARLLGWPVASAGTAVALAVAVVAGVAAVLVADLCLDQPAGGEPPGDDLAALNLAALLAEEDTLLLEREFALRARTSAVGGRLIITAITLITFAALYAGLAHLPSFATQTHLVIVLIVAALGLAVLGGEWLWRLAGFYVRVILRTTVHYWPATLSLILLLGFLTGALHPPH